MIHVRNLIIYEDLPFEEYLRMPGFSFSHINSGGKYFPTTPKMQLGKDVDAYLNEPQYCCHNDLSLVRPAALALKDRVGPLYSKFRKQVSVTCEFIYDGMIMLFKGRMDWALQNIIVVDTKVSENIKKTIHHFDYPNQISGYCIAFSCPYGLILAVHPTKHHTNLINIPIQLEWWERQILKYGDPLKS